MPHTTLANYADFVGPSYDAALETRVAYWITASERALRRLAGVDWYKAGDPTGDASLDWIEATVRLVDQALAGESEDARTARQSPYTSEKIGDYSYTLKSGAGATGSMPSEVAAIIARYAEVGGNPVFAGMVLAHPAISIGMIDYGRDVSREIEGGER